MPFHVRVSTSEVTRVFDGTHEAFAFAIGETGLRERFVVPWTNREEIYCGGLEFGPEHVRIEILESSYFSGPEFKGSDDWRFLSSRDNTTTVTDKYLRRRSSSASRRSTAPAEFRAADTAKVMVVHGRDVQARDDLFNFLRAVGLKPIGWREAVRASGKGTPYNGDAVDAAFKIAQAAIVLFTPDEQVLLRRELRDVDDREDRWEWQARPNVFYEGGIAFASHPDRTIVVEFGPVRVPSDLAGRNTIRIRSGVEWRHDLAERLRGAGCPISTEDGEWLRAGTFAEPPLEFVANEAPSVNDVPSSSDSSGDPLARLLAEIAAARGSVLAPDVVAELARRLRSLEGSTMGYALFEACRGGKCRRQQ